MKNNRTWRRRLVVLLAAASVGTSLGLTGTAGAAMAMLMPEETDDTFIIPDSSTRYLTASDLAGMTKSELRLARNEIYARHGRIFGSKDLKDYFESQSWYNGTIPGDKFDETSLNQYETKNVKLIQEAEANAPTEKKTSTGTGSGTVTPATVQTTGTGTAGQTAQTSHTGNYTDAEVVALAKRYYHDYLGQYYLTVELESSDAETVSLHVYEMMSDHTATTAWLDVNRKTGKATDTVMGTAVDLQKGSTAAQGTFIFPNSASELLTAADLAGKTKEQLRIGRNEIFARRGRKFSSADLKQYFGSCSWYKGTIDADNFSESVLNEFEKKNLELIAAAEAGEVLPSYNTGKTGSMNSQAALTEERAQAMTEIFSHWAVNQWENIDELSDSTRIVMSHDLMANHFVNPGTYKRSEVETILRSVFGSDFEPETEDYMEAGWPATADSVQLGFGDWGEDTPVSSVLDFEDLGEGEYTAVILYQKINWPETANWCTVEWSFEWDEMIGAYVIEDASLELVNSDVDLSGVYDDLDDDDDEMEVEDDDLDDDDDMDDDDDDMDDDDSFMPFAGFLR